MGFDRIVGQDNLKQRMASEVLSRRGNTFIVSGPEGCGKSLIASELAKALMCLEPGKNGACGKCRCCLYFDNGTNPDFIHIEPDKKASNIPVDRIREGVVGDYETAPRFSPNKVYLINGNYLGTESQNALLKSIEEPPADVAFIFEVTNTDVLLPTIQSRAVEYRVRAYSKEEVMKILSQLREGLSENELELLSDFADGIPGRAVRLSEDNTLSDLKADLLDLILGIPGSKVTPIIKKSDEIFAEYKENYLEPVILMIWIFQDLMRLVTDIDCESVRFRDDRTRLEKFVVANKKIGTKEIGKSLEAITTFVSDRKVNVNYDGSVTAMMLRIYKEFNT